MPQTAGKSIQTAGQNNAVKPEDAVYTFLQGPKSWGKRLTWSGKWARRIMTVANSVHSVADFVVWPIFIRRDHL